MSSKYLQYQDSNYNKILDTCDELVYTAPVNTCLKCVPNLTYVAPDWRSSAHVSGEPWLNEKTCTYQISISTKHTSLLPHAGASQAEAEEYTNTLFSDHVDEAVEALILAYKKSESTENKNKLKQLITNEEYDLSMRAISYVRLLYSVDSEDFSDLEDEQEEVDEEDTLSSSPSISTVNFNGEDFNPTILKIRKSLHLYSRYLNVFRGIEKGNLIFSGDERVFNLEDYGDNGFSGFGTLQKIQEHIEEFLNGKGLLLRGGPLVGLAENRITSITLTFSPKYKLTKIAALTHGCGGKPFVYGPKKLKTLNNKPEMKNQTAMAYIARAKEMEKDLMSREPVPWLEFLTKHTYPSLIETFNWPLPTSARSATPKSCVGEALAKKGVQLGEDLLSDTFSIADSFAYLFRDGNCKANVGEYNEGQIEFGQVPNPSGQKSFEDLLKIAKEQAYGEIEDNDGVFTELCFKFVGAKFGNRNVGAGMELWPQAFDRLKKCGLNEFMLDAMKCLMAGLTFEQAMAKVLNAALQNMSVENFGELFVGLPADKQAEIQQLVAYKIESGNVFKDGGSNEELSALIDQGADRTAIENVQPWSGEADQKMISGATAKQLVIDPFKLGEQRPRPTPEEQGELPGDRRTLGQSFDSKKGSPSAVNSSIVLQVYIQSLLEVFKEDSLVVLDSLNKFPGAPLIAQVLTYMNCPTAPAFEPNYMDFIRDIELPWCKNGEELTLPKLQNPFGWIPEWKDLGGIAQFAFKLAIQEALISMLMSLVVKVCDILGGSICKLGASAGAVAMNALSANDRTAIVDTIRDAICEGETGSVNDTVVDMFQKLGVGGAALNNQEDVINFMGDVSSVLTRAELMESFLGKMPDEAANLVNDIKTNEYPQFELGLPDADSMKTFFGNMGNLFPESLKKDMRDFADSLDEEEMLPANPSLCASPEDIDNFCAFRSQLMRGRATPEQSAEMCRSYQDGIADDLGTLADLLQNDTTPSLPPLVSDPGCDNGLIPFESPEQQAAAHNALNGSLQQIMVAYSEDMLGNGPNEKRWGMLNMILSDTMGTPLTAHYRKSFFNRDYVDFAKTWGGITQRGQFPEYVAEWLRTSMENLEIDFLSNNEYQPARPIVRSFDSLNLSPRGVKLIDLPDFGYNVQTVVDVTKKEVSFIKSPRKKTPDISFRFQDNNKGLVEEVGSTYSEGFDIDLFLSEFSPSSAPTITSNDITWDSGFAAKSELEEDHVHQYSIDSSGNGRTLITLGHSHTIVDGVVQAASASYVDGIASHTHDSLDSSSGVTNLYSDNARINITTLLNQSAVEIPSAAMVVDPDAELSVVDLFKTITGTDDVIADRAYEFLAIDNTFSTLNFDKYPNFTNSFLTKQDVQPQVILLHEILTQAGSNISKDETKSMYDSMLNKVFKTINQAVADNDIAWQYGAKYDNLTKELAQYVVAPGQTDSPGGTLYSKATINGEKLTNEDAVLGISYDQYINEYANSPATPENVRVYYLDPSTYGKTYTRPKIYIKPLKNEGWLGLIDVLFPEMSPCSPSKTDFINLKQIEDEIAASYDSIPEDERLQQNDDCIVELPYARILERSAKAGIQGLIKAACRIYASVHIIKSLATFSTFAPDFNKVCSSIYPQFIVEQMEKDFKDAQAGVFEFLNPFKDEEFWYAFLEQVVQTYSRIVDDETIAQPSAEIQRAIIRINDMQEAYEYPTKEQYLLAKSDPTDPTRAINLKRYREEQNYEAIKGTEEDAKLVLGEMLKLELNEIGSIFIENLKELNMSPEYTNMDYFVLTNLSNGGIDLSLDKEIVETAVEDIPTSGEDLYSPGGQFSSPDGTDYVGYFHVHITDEGATQYMSGPYHTDLPHDMLTLYANKVIVEIGDVEEIGYIPESIGDKPFVVEKYISIDNLRFTNSEALDILRSNQGTLNISDVYPGNLEFVFMSDATSEVLEPEDDIVVGLKGNLGVRYGVSFSIAHMEEDGSITKAEIAHVEIDALDTTIDEFAPVEGDSKILLCLLKKLTETLEFQIMSRYISSSRKAVAMTALYNDMGFLLSIGQVTVPFNSVEKPGVTVSASDTEVTYDSVPGWESAIIRSVAAGPNLFVTRWDEWDQELLRISRSKMKRIFRNYYNSRSFDISRALDDTNPFSMVKRNMLSRIKPKSGKRQIPKWSRSRITGNPFDAKGNLCEK